MLIHPTPETPIAIGSQFPFKDELLYRYLVARRELKFHEREYQRLQSEARVQGRLLNSMETLIEAEIAKGDFPEDLRTEFEAAKTQRLETFVSAANGGGRPRKSW